MTLKVKSRSGFQCQSEAEMLATSLAKAPSLACFSSGHIVLTEAVRINSRTSGLAGPGWCCPTESPAFVFLASVLPSCGLMSCGLRRRMRTSGGKPVALQEGGAESQAPPGS